MDGPNVEQGADGKSRSPETIYATGPTCESNKTLLVLNKWAAQLTVRLFQNQSAKRRPTDGYVSGGPKRETPCHPATATSSTKIQPVGKFGKTVEIHFIRAKLCKEMATQPLPSEVTTDERNFYQPPSFNNSKVSFSVLLGTLSDLTNIGAPMTQWPPRYPERI